MGFLETGAKLEKEEKYVVNKYALLIGTETFNDPAISNLGGVLKDVEKFSTILRDSELSSFEVTSLTNPLLIDARRAISDVCIKAMKDDIVFFYYSGKGVLGADKSFYLLFTDSEYKFQDATCMESEFVLSQFRKSECETFIIVIDTCHSGAFFNNNRGLPKSLVALTAGDENQMAMETEEGGVFTNTIIKGLKSDYIDANRDGKITFSELFDYITQQQSKSTESSYEGSPKKWEWNVDKDLVLFDSPRSVFISYQRQQSDLVEKISQSLIKSGISTFVDTKKIRTGDIWKELLERSIKNARAFIIVLDKEILNSEVADWELETAHKHGVPILPLAVEKVTIPALFQKMYGHYNRMDFDIDKYEYSITTVIEHIKALRVRQPEEVAEDKIADGTR
ncbi:TIR domain-containing protein [Salmonirosea aquatica]|uniref:TIR domain-containing protein n=1 Tax=Salmonirosea aquatica TaxID=2654236 RepID=A0A7C9BFW2_9BACT|nr:TIR domain-containing protein [Cytophagaceae bacterium SJW1-29]